MQIVYNRQENKILLGDSVIELPTGTIFNRFSGKKASQLIDRWLVNAGLAPAGSSVVIL